MGVNSLPKTVARQRRDCDLNPGPSAPESSTLTTRLPSRTGILKSQPASQKSSADVTNGPRVLHCRIANITLGCNASRGKGLFTAHELHQTEQVDPVTRRVDWSRASATRSTMLRWLAAGKLGRSVLG